MPKKGGFIKNPCLGMTPITSAPCANAASAIAPIMPALPPPKTTPMPCRAKAVPRSAALFRYLKSPEAEKLSSSIYCLHIFSNEGTVADKDFNTDSTPSRLSKVRSIHLRAAAAIHTDPAKAALVLNIATSTPSVYCEKTNWNVRG